MDNLALTMVSTTPDEQSQVFMVLGEDVSKSVVSGWGGVIGVYSFEPTCSSGKICTKKCMHAHILHFMCDFGASLTYECAVIYNVYMYMYMYMYV